MTPHSIDQPQGTNAHRPMSLLLQALKQIESKPATESDCELPVIKPIAPPEVDSTHETLAADTAAESPSVPDNSTFHLIRHYHVSETMSEVALANPVDLPSLPSTLEEVKFSGDEPTANERGWFVRGERSRLADEIVGLLPDESRAVVAILSVNGVAAAPVVHDVCEGLAARNAGDVLAIAEVDADSWQDWLEKPTFKDAIAGRAKWRDTLLRDRHDRYTMMARGGLPGREAGSQRRLLKLWEEIGERFAFVVLDASGHNPDDILPVVATCDAAFIAVRLNETNRGDTARLVDKVRRAGCQPCGCLVAEAC
ncbi:MAG TPA: hypothetical protein VHC22_30515 [Pirellulales bacterium]|nr:hypothetical protein [Pirellulales bacterium]